MRLGDAASGGAGLWHSRRPRERCRPKWDTRIAQGILFTKAALRILVRLATLRRGFSSPQGKTKTRIGGARTRPPVSAIRNALRQCGQMGPREAGQARPLIARWGREWGPSCDQLIKPGGLARLSQARVPGQARTDGSPKRGCPVGEFCRSLRPYSTPSLAWHARFPSNHSRTHLRG